MKYGQIADIFGREGYAWRFSDGTRVPNEDEISKTVWAAIDALSTEPDNTQVEVGRLIVKKKGQFYDIYLHVAEQRVVVEE